MTAPSYFSRISQCLNEASQRLGGFRHLEKDILSTLKRNRNPLSRRQLAKLCKGEDFGIPIATWEAVDRYLQLRWGTSLTQLWGSRSVLQELVTSDMLAFIIGSQPDSASRRIDLSRWDIRAMRDVLNQISRGGSPPHILFEDVIFRGNRVSSFRSGNVSEKEAWYHLISAENGPAIVSLGSPKTNHCAEELLGRMLEVQPFTRWPSDRSRPFAFIWPRGTPGSEVCSCVRLDPKDDAEEIRGLSGMTSKLWRGLQASNSHTLAVVIEGIVYPVYRRGTHWETYAIVAARRVGKRTHVCVAGLTGPATLGATRMLADFAPRLQLKADTGQSATAWMVVKSAVREHKGESFRLDERHVESSEIVGGIRYFPAPEPDAGTQRMN